jgi:hypothetical protein
VGCTAGAAALSCPANARNGVNANITNANARRESMGITAVTTETQVMFTQQSHVLRFALQRHRARLQHPFSANTLRTL